MISQLSYFSKGFATLVTIVVLHVGMAKFMLLQKQPQTKRLHTNRAGEWFFLRVETMIMFNLILFTFKPFAANLTLKRSKIQMDLLVFFQLFSYLETPVANVTDVRQTLGVESLMIN